MIDNTYRFVAQLPKHKCGLYIEHNTHKSSYESIEEYTADFRNEEWVSVEEKKRAIETNELWQLQWYPDTPVGFHILLASSLEAIIDHLNREDNNGRETDE